MGNVHYDNALCVPILALEGSSSKTAVQSSMNELLHAKEKETVTVIKMTNLDALSVPDLEEVDDVRYYALLLNRGKHQVTIAAFAITKNYILNLPILEVVSPRRGDMP